MNRFCQSCGMPLSQDPKHGGTHSNGSRSGAYCSYCYANGEFTDPAISAQNMQYSCFEKLQEKGLWRPLAWLLTRNVPRLKRWKDPEAARQVMH
jgi:hypothetical protein